MYPETVQGAVVSQPVVPMVATAPIVNQPKVNKTLLMASFGLQGILVLGLGLVFGGFRNKYAQVAEVIDPQYERVKAYMASGGKRPNEIELKNSIVLLGRLKNEDFDMVLAGFILFILSSVALLVIYKGAQRGAWIVSFSAAALAQIAGIYLHNALSPEKIMEKISNREDFQSTANSYVGMLVVSVIVSIVAILMTKIFDRHGGVTRGICKFLFWVAFMNTIFAPTIGILRAGCWEGPFGMAVTMLTIGFVAMVILGAYAIASEAYAALYPAPQAPVIHYTSGSTVIVDGQKIVTV